MGNSRFYIGLMSGTSLDAADAALVEFAPDPDTSAAIPATHALPLAPDLRGELLAFAQPRADIGLSRLGRLNQRLGDCFAQAALGVMAMAGATPTDIAAIGSHGQTVWHEPGSDIPFSMQLGSPSRIAARTGCPVTADFRNSDMAVGGQGAPLVPAFHRGLFACADSARIVVNIGGIANITLLPAGSDRDAARVAGLDTGPGNALMDNWIQTHLGHTMDANGRWAAGGSVHAPLLESMLQEPYLKRPPPKSTGREYFNLHWLQTHIDSLKDPPSTADVQATLCEYTARTIAMAVADYGPGDEEILVCGGGVRNTQLMTRLTALLAPRTVETTSSHGLNADWVEAAAFAWLAKRRLEGRPGNLPSVTGARCPAVLGAVYVPPGASDGE